MKRSIVLFIMLTLLLASCVPPPDAGESGFILVPPAEQEERWELVTHTPAYSPAYYILYDAAADEKSREVLPEHSLYFEIKAMLAGQPEQEQARQGDFQIIAYEADGSISHTAHAYPGQGEWYGEVFALYSTAVTEQVAVELGAELLSVFFETHSAGMYAVRYALQRTLAQDIYDGEPPEAPGFTVWFYTYNGCCLEPYLVTPQYTLIGDQRYADAGLYAAVNALYTHGDCADCLHR